MNNQKIEQSRIEHAWVEEKEKEPRIEHSISAQTAEEEFQYILKLIERHDFYQEHGYRVILPELEEFSGLAGVLDEEMISLKDWV